MNSEEGKVRINYVCPICGAYRAHVCYDSIVCRLVKCTQCKGNFVLISQASLCPCLESRRVFCLSFPYMYSADLVEDTYPEKKEFFWAGGFYT
jgi:hypothetical protein